MGIIMLRTGLDRARQEEQDVLSIMCVSMFVCVTEGEDRGYLHL